MICKLLSLQKNKLYDGSAFTIIGLVLRVYLRGDWSLISASWFTIRIDIQPLKKTWDIASINELKNQFRLGSYKNTNEFGQTFRWNDSQANLEPRAQRKKTWRSNFDVCLFLILVEDRRILQLWFYEKEHYWWEWIVQKTYWLSKKPKVSEIPWNVSWNE